MISNYSLGVFKCMLMEVVGAKGNLFLDWKDTNVHKLAFSQRRPTSFFIVTPEFYWQTVKHIMHAGFILAIAAAAVVVQLLKTITQKIILWMILFQS